MFEVDEHDTHHHFLLPDDWNWLLELLELLVLLLPQLTLGEWMKTKLVLRHQIEMHSQELE